MEQRTEEWFRARAGHLTSSNAAVIMGGLDTTGLANLVKSLAWERVYGPLEESYKSPAMLLGIEREPDAREWYQFETGVEIEEVGFVKHPNFDFVGASPDGISPKRVIEIKCPGHKAWMDVKRTAKVPSEYRWQTKWVMWCARVVHCDFVAHHPIAGGLIVPCELSHDDIEKMSERAHIVNLKINDWVEILTDKKGNACAE